MKKVRVIQFLGLLVPLLLSAPSLFADVAADLKQAEELCQARQYAQAEAAYKQIATANAGTDAALAAQRGLAILYVKTRQDSLLSQTWESITAGFGGHKDTPSTLSRIADECRNANRHELALPFYQYVVDHWPQDKDTVWQQANVATCCLCLANEEKANAAFQRLQTDYGKDANFRQAVCTIGDNLRWRNLNPQAARQMYTLAASGEAYADMIWARMGLAISCIQLKDFKTAGPVAESLAADFGKDSRVGQALCHTADAYRDAAKRPEAQRLYQYVVDRNPDDDYVMWSQAGLAICAVRGRDEAATQAAIEKLRTSYANRRDFAGALGAVADNCRWREAYVNARDLYALAAANGPDHPNDIWFQMGLAISGICTGDMKTAQTALDRLHNHYRDHPGLTQALYEVGCTFSNAGQFGHATQEFNQVITAWPNTDYALKSKVGLGLIQFRQGNIQAAEAIYQQIMTDHANRAKLAEAIDLMAEGYLDQGVALEKAEAKRVGPTEYAKIVRSQGRSEIVKDYYHRAIEKWQIIIQKMPLSDRTPRAWYFTGVAYRRHLGEPEKAMLYYEKVVGTWPDYEYAWNAQQMLAVCYETLVRSGRMTKEVAWPKLEAAYKGVLEKYLDSPSAEQAYLKLGILYLSKAEPAQAAVYFQQFLERYPRAKQWTHALILLGMTYDQRGKPEIAAELYRSYLDTANPDDPRIKLLRARLDKEQEVQK